MAGQRLPIINCASRESHLSASSRRTHRQNLIKPEPFSTSIIRNTQFTQVIRPPNYNPMFLHARLPPLIAPSLGSANGPRCSATGPGVLPLGGVSGNGPVLVFLRQWVQHGGDPGHSWEPSCRLGTPPGREGGCRVGVSQGRPALASSLQSVMDFLQFPVPTASALTSSRKPSLAP